MLNKEEVNKLFEDNKKLVGFCFSKYVNNYNQDYEDIMQEGYLELYKCCQRFDPELGNSFSTYAIPSIRGVMMRYIREKQSVIRIPRRLFDGSDENKDKINIIKNYRSLDFELPNGDSINLQDIIPASPDDYEFEIIELIESILSEINNPIHKNIIEEYWYSNIYGDGVTQTDLMKKYHVSQPQVSRVIKKYNNIIIKYLEDG